MMTYARHVAAPRRGASPTRGSPACAIAARQTAGTLSGGEQQMLALARGLATDPALLILDELSMGLAPLVVEELFELVAQVAAEGVAILVVEQFASIVLDVADHVGPHGQRPDRRGRVARTRSPTACRRPTSEAERARPARRAGRSRLEGPPTRARFVEQWVNHRPNPAGDVMMEQQDRVEQFKNEIADMGLRDPATEPRADAAPARRASCWWPDRSSPWPPTSRTSSGRQRPAPAGRRPDHRPHRRGRGVLGPGLFLRYSIGPLPALLAGPPVLRAAGPDRSPDRRLGARRRRPPPPAACRPAHVGPAGHGADPGRRPTHRRPHPALRST